MNSLGVNLQERNFENAAVHMLLDTMYEKYEFSAVFTAPTVTGADSISLFPHSVIQNHLQYSRSHWLIIILFFTVPTVIAHTT